MTGYVEGTP